VDLAHVPCLAPNRQVERVAADVTAEIDDHRLVQTDPIRRR
jgi:hypothetical protein